MIKRVKSILISAVVITLNEERNIARCIDALEGIADEIVVLDSGSTDATRRICEQKGVAFHTRPFDDYAEQKNRAAALAKHDFILSVDADEAPSETLRASIFAAKAGPKADVYSMNRLTSYCGRWVKHCGWYPDTKIRLYDRRKAQWTGKRIHEKVTPDAGARHAKLEGDLLHYSFYTIDQHMATVNRFSTLKAELLHEKGRGASIAKMILSAPVKFLKIFLFKAGFLDGSAGFHIAVNSAHGDYLKYAKLRELQKGSR